MVELMKGFLLASAFALVVSCGMKSSDKDEQVNSAVISAKGAEQSDENNKTVNCFVYHRFGDDRFPSTNISIQQFRAHLDYLKSNGVEVMTLSEAITYLKEPGQNKEVVVLTIDDGYKSFYHKALPILEEYGFPATLFINTETVGGGDYMDWDEIKSAKTSGIEIGNHTHSHAFFLSLPEKERYEAFEDEINKSQDIIEEQLGEKPIVFAYPYGEYDTKMLNIVKDFGFKAAVAQNSGVIHSGSEMFALPRFPMAEAYASLDRFSQKANMLPLKIAKTVPESFMLSDPGEAPELTLLFEKADLHTDQIQCFVQGGSCEMNKAEDDGQIELTLKAKSPLTARRTLYTITVPDREGNWHWFSHLWINPDVADR